MGKNLEIRYEDTDKKLEVNLYGKKIFKINEGIVGELDTKKLQEEEPSVEKMEKLINDILGEGAVDEINKIREVDGYDKMELSHELALVMYIIEYYVNTLIKPIDNMTNRYRKEYNKRRNNYNRNNRYRRY